jgi:putative oxidoreductase
MNRTTIVPDAPGDVHVTTPRADTQARAALALLRITAGLLLLQHGVQKQLGLLLPPDQPPREALAAFSLPWIAGWLELVGGTLIVLGLFTRPVAFVLSGFMAAAYFIGHAGRAVFPILNGGELPALFAFVFLLLAAAGAGRWSLDEWRATRRAPR